MRILYELLLEFETAAGCVAPAILISTIKTSTVIPKTAMKVCLLLTVSYLAFFILQLPDGSRVNANDLLPQLFKLQFLTELE